MSEVEHVLNYKDRNILKNEPAKRPASARTLAISSGKGGVGKTLTVVHIAKYFAANGLRTLILDGDMGLANVDIVLGLQPKYNIRDVLDGSVPLEKIILKERNGIDVIPTGSGLADLASLSYSQKQVIKMYLEELDGSYDYIIVDTAAGISDNVLHFSEIVQKRLVVCTGEPHSLTDAYAFIKVMVERRNVKEFFLVVNMVQSTSEGEKIYRNMKKVCQDFLGIDLNYLGSVPHDRKLSEMILKRNLSDPRLAASLSGQAWGQISQKVISEFASDASLDGHGASFWQTL